MIRAATDEKSVHAPRGDGAHSECSSHAAAALGPKTARVECASCLASVASASTPAACHTPPTPPRAVCAAPATRRLAS
eukprot:1059898-Prymnesium_polylepis.1